MLTSLLVAAIAAASANSPTTTVAAVAPQPATAPYCLGHEDGFKSVAEDETAPACPLGPTAPSDDQSYKMGFRHGAALACRAHPAKCQ